MENDPATIAHILIASPLWSRLALTSGSPRLVERGAASLAEFIADRLSEPVPMVQDDRQLSLPIR